MIEHVNEDCACNGKRCPKCNKEKCLLCFSTRRVHGNIHPYGYCRDCHKEYRKEYERAHAKKLHECRVKWRHDNPDKWAKSQKAWAKNNPKYFSDIRRAIWANRRDRKLNAGGSFTVQEWQALCEKYHSRCLCCGRDDVSLTADHVIPLALGGSSNIDNIQPLCLKCNQKKHVRIMDFRNSPNIHPKTLDN